ncbi:peptidoglycan-binding protein [Pedobacter sp. L105]|uniref:CIS tube protein n=1 Tax=Pedobacter sp. L105 TaxID=1641871 RepID=UPI00131C8E97|nr:peptidoglycan-binding protein [Pedobacter sp. L105]
MPLEKLQIQSFSDQACTKSTSAPISAFINPDNYTRTSKVMYRDEEVIGNAKQTKVYAGMGNDSLAFSKVVVDGTGLVSLGSYTDADAYILAFRNIVCNFNGSIHQTNFLMVTWGKLKFTGVCDSFKVNYTLFKPDGSTLRAFIDFNIATSVDPVTKSKEAKMTSPDLTHMRTVMAGDTLPLMTYRIYGDSSYYLEVARVNGLKNINALKPGDEIYFPPLKK